MKRSEILIIEFFLNTFFNPTVFPLCHFFQVKKLYVCNFSVSVKIPKFVQFSLTDSLDFINWMINLNGYFVFHLMVPKQYNFSDNLFKSGMLVFLIAFINR